MGVHLSFEERSRFLGGLVCASGNVFLMPISWVLQKTPATTHRGRNEKKIKRKSGRMSDLNRLGLSLFVIRETPDDPG